METRQPCSTGVSDEEWAFVAFVCLLLTRAGPLLQVIGTLSSELWVHRGGASAADGASLAAVSTESSGRLPSSSLGNHAQFLQHPQAITQLPVFLNLAIRKAVHCHHS